MPLSLSMPSLRHRSPKLPTEKKKAKRTLTSMLPFRWHRPSNTDMNKPQRKQQRSKSLERRSQRQHSKRQMILQEYLLKDDSQISTSMNGSSSGGSFRRHRHYSGSKLWEEDDHTITTAITASTGSSASLGHQMQDSLDDSNNDFGLVDDLPVDEDDSDSSESMTLEEQRQSLHTLQAQQLKCSLAAPSRAALLQKKAVRFAESVDQDEERRQARQRNSQGVCPKFILDRPINLSQDGAYDTSSLMALLDGIYLTAFTTQAGEISSDEDSDCPPDDDGIGYLI